jgi:hypothetical protein
MKNRILLISSGLFATALLFSAISVTAERLPGSAHGGRLFLTTLSGVAEAPGPGSTNGTGRAAITVNHGQGELCFVLEVTNLEPAIAAHVHRGAVGVAGPVVVPLTPPGTNGLSHGCVKVDRGLIKEILQHPDRFYVNVHTAPLPAGAVRGQLSQ